MNPSEEGPMGTKKRPEPESVREARLAGDHEALSALARHGSKVKKRKREEALRKVALGTMSAGVPAGPATPPANNTFWTVSEAEREREARKMIRERNPYPWDPDD